MSTKNDFTTWAEENTDLLSSLGVSREKALLIWEAARYSLANSYIQMVYDGEITITKRS